MAMALDALASYLLNLLTEMTKDEVKTLFGACSEMEKMSTKLGHLKKFLADADRRNITDEAVLEWVRELKGAMYDATDIIDLCHLKIMKRGKRLDAGCNNPLLFCMRDPLFAHDIGSRMKKLNQKLDDIKKRSEPFNFINLGPKEDHRRNSKSLHNAIRETSGELNESSLVGEKIEEDTRNLVERMTKEVSIREQKTIMVFAIVGVGGIGKTTLAQMIFNDDTIKEKFTKRLWLSVNQDFDIIELLRKAITEAEGDHQAPLNTKAALERALKKALTGHKTIMVMDDVWDNKAWVDVLETPLTQALVPGSCVLVTTRHVMVARGMKAVEPYHCVEKLKFEDGWCLLKKQVIINETEESQIDMLKDIGIKIIEKCDGLPLAIKVMGGLLLQKRNRRSDWEMVLNDSIWSVSQMPEELNYAIYLSYQDFRPNLKPCFLHFSLLPKSTSFYVDDIVGMWISEGFVHGSSGNLEELGKEYYHELILRNLLEPNTKYIDQMVCSMHDVVRSFAQYVAGDESLAYSNNIDICDKLNSKKLFRISVDTKGSGSSNKIDWVSLQNQISLRTLVLVGWDLPTKVSFVTFSSLRTLHVDGYDGDGLAKSLGQLKHLRYLSVDHSSTFVLPGNIGKMKFLQHISLSHCPSMVKLPSSIGKLQHLRFLRVNDSNIYNVPNGFSDLTNMRKLYGFPAHMDGERCSLEELGPLSKLIELQIDGLEKISSPSFARNIRLSEKILLSFRSLSCNRKNRDEGILQPYDKISPVMEPPQIQQNEEVFDELCPPTCLENLIITNYFGRRLPVWMTSRVNVPLQSLRILTLRNLPWCTELPDGLCQLPCLEVLQIIDAPAITSIGPELSQAQNQDHHGHWKSFSSVVRIQVAECCGLVRIINLPKTEELTIYDCPELKVLEHMSGLCRVDLEDYKMKTLPGYLKDSNPVNLKVACDVSLLTSMAAGKFGPEWDRFGHIKHVKAYADDDTNRIENKWFVTYTKDPFYFKTNISTLPMPSS